MILSIYPPEEGMDERLRELLKISPDCISYSIGAEAGIVTCREYLAVKVQRGDPEL